MRVGIYYRDHSVDRNVIERALRRLEQRGASACIFPEEGTGEKPDRLLVFGGDGAVLRAARRAAEEGIPLLAVNFGHLGFLTEFEREEWEKAVDLVADEDCGVIRRSMLEVVFCKKTSYCLNEAALMRRIAPDTADGAVRIGVEIDGSEAGEFTADGLIVATPTGSTAYSLSAGGCILAPDSAVFLLTPVNAFSLRSRPIVCPDRSELRFTLLGEGAVVLHGDGKFLGEAARGDEIVVRKAARYASFLTKGKNNFFRRLTEKIN